MTNPEQAINVIPVLIGDGRYTVDAIYLLECSPGSAIAREKARHGQLEQALRTCLIEWLSQPGAYLSLPYEVMIDWAHGSAGSARSTVIEIDWAQALAAAADSSDFAAPYLERLGVKRIWALDEDDEQLRLSNFDDALSINATKLGDSTS